MNFIFYVYGSFFYFTAAAVELIQLREELKASRRELEEERSTCQTLAGKLQV
jgi:hypothetical protein